MATTKPLFKPKIAIIGAGPAGLTLGRMLHLQEIPFTVFESEPSPNSRSQGGSLDLRDKTGLAAIRACELYDEFLKLARFDGEALKICDKDYKVWFEVDGRENSRNDKKRASGARPEIDRVVLRALLMGSIPEEKIEWGKKLKTVTEEEGNLKLVFEGGEEAGGFDLIVGADGTWSKTRKFLSDEMPAYSGICGTEHHISDAENKFQEASKMVNGGSIFAFGQGRSVSVQQIGDGSIKVAQYAVRDVRWAKENDAATMDPAAMKKLLGNELKDWAPEFRTLFDHVDEQGAVTRVLFTLPIGFHWENKKGVTVIGDAAHVMVPFAGEGANVSMADGMYLAQWIQKSTDGPSLHENVAKFEKEMFKRIKPVQQISHDNMQDMFFTPGAPRTTIERYLTRMVKRLIGPVFGTLAGVAISTYYWGFKLLN